MIGILLRTVDIFFTVLYVLLFVRVILSWFTGGRTSGGGLMELLYTLTEPFLAPIRRLINQSPLGGPGMVIDFSPIIAFFLLQLLQRFIGLLMGL